MKFHFIFQCATLYCNQEIRFEMGFIPDANYFIEEIERRNWCYIEDLSVGNVSIYCPTCRNSAMFLEKYEKINRETYLSDPGPKKDSK